ncbi:MAG: ATP-dependent helicase HrpB [Candidatus Cryptobacteroides sp.]
MKIRIDETAGRLPAAAIADDVNRRLEKNPVLVITAPPGAGKSTFLPLTIFNGLQGKGKVIVLEPRRIAAVQIAERMAEIAGENVGGSIGYRIRFENKVSAGTRIEVLTEGILTRRLVSDPALEGVSVVIFDEFHERSLVSDEALALVREAREILRPDLKIVIMSATIDTDAICEALGADAICSEGRMFPVEIINSREDVDIRDCAAEVARCISRAHREREGDILAFLPGEAEIRRCTELLGDSLGGTHVRPLYGMLSQKEQRDAIAPSRKCERKVVIATPIAETSLTIEGIRTVVDSGLCRRMVFDRQTGLSRLETVRISMDMAMQRSGRAGRVAPGTCYRLWSKGAERLMKPCRTPEILDADLAATVLEASAWGENDVMKLPWLTPPPAGNAARAYNLLKALGALDAEGRITDEGRRIASLPCHPRIARMLLAADTQENRALGADIAAILEERDPMARENDTDICLRISELRRLRRNRLQDRGWNRIIRTAQQYRRIVNCDEDNTEPDRYIAGTLIAAAYPERVAKRRDNCGHFQLACGDMADVGMSDGMSSHEWIAVAAMNAGRESDGRIFMAAPLNPEDISYMVRMRDNVTWDSRTGSVTARRESRIGCLTVDSRPLGGDDVRDKIVRAICEAAPKEGTSMFDFSDDVRNLQRRIALVSSWHPELELPDLSTESFLGRTEEWLPGYIGKASTAAELKKIDLCEVIWGMLGYDLQQAVERIAPSHLKVPTGSRIKVEYRQGTDIPAIKVRLQECFGMSDTPRIDGGRVPVLMDLLSPGYKSVQLTSDLRSFWENTYFEVRKELRRRYPKHSWPDNPLEAEAVRGVKRKA